MPLFGAAVALLVIVVFVPSLNYVVGGSARFLRIGPLPLFHPAEVAKLALVVYLAHWFARRGSGIREFWRGTVVFLVISAPVILLVLREPDIGTTTVLAFTPIVMFFVAGANLLHLGALGSTVRSARPPSSRRTTYALTRVRAFIDPWSDPAGSGFHTIQGLLALGLGGLLGSASARAAWRRAILPNAYNDFIFAIIGEEFGLVGAVLVILLFVVIGSRASGSRWAPRIRSGRCWPPASRPGCASRRSSTSGWWWRSCRSPASRCRS